MKWRGFSFASVVFIAGMIIATGLVTILLRNPATHRNLEDPEFYDRTELAFLGQDYIYAGYGSGAGLIEAGADPHLVGKALYVRTGCVGCHGIFGEGAVVGPNLWAIEGEEESSDFIRDVRDGPGGMPPYPATYLSDDDLRLVLTYLDSAPSDAAAAGVTTTTTTVTTAPAPSSTTTTAGADPGATTTTISQAPLEVEAPDAAITVDGDISDWEAVPNAQLTLEPIIEHEAPPKQAAISVAHDDSFIYVLFSVEDDFNWSEIDPHFAGAPAIMWPVESAAGPHMGGEDPSGHPALGLVDIWYWRLDCPLGVEQGGAVSGPGSGDPGNDDACNFDDEWASDPDNHDDDVGPDAENSLLGVFTHTNPIEDGEGIWYFEMRRPLLTGDPQDAQFDLSQPTRLALAYWDPDAGQNGWGRRDHVQSSNRGWIHVVFTD